MSSLKIASIQKQLDLRETEDLVEIWRLHDKAEWTEAAFEAIRNILTDRLGEPPLFEDIEAAQHNLEQAEEFLESDDFYKALDKCNLAIQLAPHYGYAYYVKGLVFDCMGKMEAAVKLYEEALRLSPDLPEVRKYLSWAMEELARKSTNSEERILAALAHGGIFISTIGLLLPAIIWITQREKSRYVAFQSLQALAFQILAACFELILGIFTAFRFVAMPFASLKPIADSPWFYLALSVIYLFQILFWLFGLIGVITTFRGKPFKYPILRGITEKLTMP
jgi:uncharacterized Tic20 family protein